MANRAFVGSLIRALFLFGILAPPSHVFAGECSFSALEAASRGTDNILAGRSLTSVLEEHPGPREGCPLCAWDLRAQGVLARLVSRDNALTLVASSGKEVECLAKIRSRVVDLVQGPNMEMTENAQNCLIVLDRSNSDNITRRLEWTPKDVRLVVDLPTTSSEFKGVFGKGEPSGWSFALQEAVDLEFRALARQAGIVYVPKVRQGRAEALLTQIRMAVEHDELVIVVAHVEHGSVCLADGGRVAVAEATALGNCWVIGCHTAASIRCPPGVVVAPASMITDAFSLRLVQSMIPRLGTGRGSVRRALTQIQEMKTIPSDCMAAVRIAVIALAPSGKGVGGEFLQCA